MRQTWKESDLKEVVVLVAAGVGVLHQQGVVGFLHQKEVSSNRRWVFAL